MNNNKQTAVEWFVEQLEKKGDAWENASIGRIQISIEVEDYIELKRQGKQMQNEQIKNAWYDGLTNKTVPNFVFDKVKQEAAEHYCNQTYGKE